MLSYATPRTAIIVGIDAGGRGTACAGALVDAAMAAKAAAHSTTNVFKGKNPSTGGCGGIVYTTAPRTARPLYNTLAD
jgi:hypothetical protein